MVREFKSCSRRNICQFTSPSPPHHHGTINYFHHDQTKGVYPHVRPCPRSCPHPQWIQYCSSHVYPLAYSRSRSRSRSCSRSSAIGLVIESECERTGADVDTYVDTLLNTADISSQVLWKRSYRGFPNSICLLTSVTLLNVVGHSSHLWKDPIKHFQHHPWCQWQELMLWVEAHYTEFSMKKTL